MERFRITLNGVCHADCGLGCFFKSDICGGFTARCLLK